MRIDPKHFYRFLGIVAIICIVLIAFFSMHYSRGQGQRFQEIIGDGSEIYTHEFAATEAAGDSLSASEFQGSMVLINFWSPWARRSITAHEHIHHIMGDSDKNLEVIALKVKDSDENVLEYIRETNYSYRYADGTDVYQELNVPGVPAFILFDEDGTLLHVQVGYSSESDLNFLRIKM